MKIEANNRLKEEFLLVFFNKNHTITLRVILRGILVFTVAFLYYFPTAFSAVVDADYPVYPPLSESDNLSENSARRGWMRLVYENKIDQARADFEQTLLEQPENIWAAYGLILIRVVRSDYERLLLDSLAIVKRRPDHPLSFLILRGIENLFGKVAGYGKKVEPVLKQILADSDTLDPELRTLAYAILTKIYDYRCDRENYEKALAQLGRIRKWNTLGPYGKFNNVNFFAELLPETDRWLKASYEYEGERTLKKSFTSVDGEINPPWFEKGLCFAETFIRSPRKSRVLLKIRSHGSIKLILNNHEIYSKDLIKQYGASTELVETELEKGWNRILLKFLYDPRSPDVSVAVISRDGSLFTADTKKHGYSKERPCFNTFQPRICEFFEEFLEQNPDDAFATGMLGMAWGLYGDNQRRKSLLYQSLELNPRFAYFNYMLATALRSDQSQPEKIATSKARRFFKEALDLADTYPAALWRLSRFDRDENKYSAAIDKLKLAIRQSPDYYLWYRTLYNIYTTKGWERERRETLERMIELLPDSPASYRIGWWYYLEKNDEEMLEQMTEKLSRMYLVSDWRARFEESRGNLEGARRQYESLLKERPYNLDFAEALLDILLKQADLDAARRLLHEIIPIAPRYEQETYREKLAQVYSRLNRHRAARKTLEKILEHNPLNRPVRNALNLLGRKDILDRFELEPFQYINQAGFLEQYGHYAAVMLIDQIVQEVYPDMSNRQKIHQLIWVNSKAAIDEWAEVDLPEDCEILELRTIKKDGAIAEPEIIGPLKETISMTDVAEGDFIEIKYITGEQPSSIFSRGYLGLQFYFQLKQYPIIFSQYVLIYPRTLEFLWENANGAAEPATGKIDRYRLYAVWEHRNNPAITPEPFSVSDDQYMPYVQVGCNLLQQTIPKWYANINMAWLKPTYELQKALNQITEGCTEPAEKMGKIYDFVSCEISGGSQGALMSEDASITLAARRGSRLALLKCFLDMAGIDSEVIMAKRFGQKDSPIFPHTYPEGLISTSPIEGKPMYMDVTRRYYPFGFINPRVQAMEALPVQAWDRRHEAAFAIPALDPDTDRSICQARLELEENGALSGHITRTFRGSTATMLRQNLIEAEQYQIRNQLQRLLSSNFRAAELKNFEVKALDRINEPLQITYAFRVNNYARIEDKNLVLDQGLYLINAATTYVRVPERKIPMQINSNINHDYRVELILPEGFAVKEHPGRLHLQGAFGAYTSGYDEENGRLVYTKKFDFPLQKITPLRYAEFKDFCVAIDDFEKKDLIISPVKATDSARIR